MDTAVFIIFSGVHTRSFIRITTVAIYVYIPYIQNFKNTIVFTGLSIYSDRRGAGDCRRYPDNNQAISFEGVLF